MIFRPGNPVSVPYVDEDVVVLKVKVECRPLLRREYGTAILFTLFFSWEDGSHCAAAE